MSKKDTGARLGDKEYQLTGTIINKVHIPPGCGVLASATVIEFEITKYSDTAYANKAISIIIPCPETYGKGFFRTGKLYDVLIAETNASNPDWVISNESVMKKYNLKYKPWAAKIKKLD